MELDEQFVERASSVEDRYQWMRLDALRYAVEHHKGSGFTAPGTVVATSEKFFSFLSGQES